MRNASDVACPPIRPALMSVIIQKACTDIMQQHKSGSTEAFYQRMLQVDLYHKGIPCLAEVDVFCLSGAVPVCVGRLDLEVDHSVILELKVASHITAKHIQQLMKYVRARTLTGMHVTEAAVVCFTDRDTVEFYWAHKTTLKTSSFFQQRPSRMLQMACPNHEVGGAVF